MKVSGDFHRGLDLEDDYPTGSRSGIFTYIYHKNQMNVGRYTSRMDPMGILD